MTGRREKGVESPVSRDDGTAATKRDEVHRERMLLSALLMIVSTISNHKAWPGQRRNRDQPGCRAMMTKMTLHPHTFYFFPQVRRSSRTEGA